MVSRPATVPLGTPFDHGNRTRQHDPDDWGWVNISGIHQDGGIEASNMGYGDG